MDSENKENTSNRKNASKQHKAESIDQQFGFDQDLEADTKNADLENNNFLFSQIDWDEQLDEEIPSNNNSSQNKSETMEYEDQGFDQYTNMVQPPSVEPVSVQVEKIPMPDPDEQRSLHAAKLLNYLISIEGVYAPDPSYFQNSQPEITSIMRAILLDWMMEVWNEFTLKRETYYYSVNYVDRFLSAHGNIKKEQLQLVGVTSMFIAAKMEEVYSPRVADFAKSTDNGYEVEEIVAMEKLMLKELGWYMTPPTYAMWANWYMNQWDIFISTNEYALSHPLIQNSIDLTFKSSHESSYTRFREVMQIMDLIILDHTSLLYQPRGLVVSIMFLILGIYTGEFDVQKIWNEFTFSSNGFLNPESEFNQLFIEFIFLSFGFQLHDLAPTIQYVSSFMGIPFNYDLPMCFQNKSALDGHFEEFLSHQTHHPLALRFIEERINNANTF